MNIELQPIGVMRSAFVEKFAIPRQPSLAPAARGRILLDPPYDTAEAVAGLEQVSHIWLLFVFHQAGSGPQHTRVRPPRLGGNQRIGVFASRATHRPNPLGQSVVRLEQVAPGCLTVSGIDLLDGTPILDIKPYVPYADIVSAAHNHLAPSPPPLITVSWQAEALAAARQAATRLGEPVVELIDQCLAQDPRPAYQQPGPEREYGVRLWDLNVRFHYVQLDHIRVLGITPTTRTDNLT
ncbi:tRNA (N6-threonylcarbamoyladenosine(37)-N6)-methyltransferase TrmO [Halopseudomonas salegens]|uniref:tRNA-Thr(GGU) m(6)t(6)A37 methyltransferase TsaA n=1 Tax=Halopseudomonas salegens TaxID=1434072 RepID=A0A1H2HPB7_9GAMM|nr:tRNA (N6-threonylcarbamoyladenosine(37)-N6)-methyltransferase TrmO [Halopseudomonas salegens]SDU33741.1 tRNA-Thr(GGU) m(6)t(6)A37 methyltransferase TsaA [Halopseudomonas salegens]